MEDDKDSRASSSRSIHKLRKILQTYPRTFYLHFGVIFPLLFLNLTCFICGHFLAKMEMQGELESNDAFLRKIFGENALEATDNEKSRRAFRNLTDLCFHLYEINESELNSSFNISISHGNDTEIKTYLNDCIKENLEDIISFQDPTELLLKEETSKNDLTYDWMLCAPEEKEIETEINLNLRSKRAAVESFYESFLKIRDLIMFMHNDDMKAQEFQQDLMENLERVSGHDNCRVHSAAGAFFWFTVMTTIGYGNAVPQTESGRAMVFTLGFLSILLFGAVNGQAGYVSLAIADDFFRRHNLKFLTKGMGASIFWICAYAFWNLFISGIVMSWAHFRSGETIGLGELGHTYWFAYISTTTVGFGDFYLKHEVVTYPDLLYLPPIILFGFVFLANFLIKFAEWISGLASKYYGKISMNSLNEILEKEILEKESERQIKTGEINT